MGNAGDLMLGFHDSLRIFILPGGCDRMNEWGTVLLPSLMAKKVNERVLFDFKGWRRLQPGGWKNVK